MTYNELRELTQQLKQKASNSDDEDLGRPRRQNNSDNEDGLEQGSAAAEK